MNKELDALKAVFLAPTLDEETRAENEEQLRQWEQQLIESEAFQSWKDHDITKQIVAKAKSSYVECAIMLATRRNLTDDKRQAVYAQQDAIKWLLSLTEVDAKGAMEAVQQKIRAALNATS